MILDQPTVARADFEAATGWELKPEGACKGDVCIPLPDDVGGDALDVTALAGAMNLPLVHDDGQGLWALGPESVGGRTLVTAEAPELELPTLDGDLFRLSSLRGQKVLLVAWAPY